MAWISNQNLTLSDLVLSDKTKENAVDRQDYSGSYSFQPIDPDTGMPEVNEDGEPVYKIAYWSESYILLSRTETETYDLDGIDLASALAFVGRGEEPTKTFGEIALPYSTEKAYYVAYEKTETRSFSRSSESGSYKIQSVVSQTATTHQKISGT